MKELIRLSCCSGDGWGMEGTGEAGRIAKITAMAIPDYVVADGNSGVNMKQRNIGMPSGACYAASFNAELVSEFFVNFTLQGTQQWPEPQFLNRMLKQKMKKRLNKR